MKIVIGSDHAGFKLKNQIIDYILSNQPKYLINNTDYEIIDLGCNSPKSCDFPIYAKEVCTYMEKFKETNFGILICGSGIGMSIAANRNSYIRCALCRTVEDAKMSREHNNANVLALGERVTDPETAKNIVATFLHTKFSDVPKYKSRMDQINSSMNQSIPINIKIN